MSGWIAENDAKSYLIDPVPASALPTVIPQTPTLAPAQIDCRAAPPTQFNIGMPGTVRTAAANATPNSVRMREKPAVAAKLVGTLAQNIAFKIVGGPQCADNFVWWQITADNGLSGWVAEGADKYYIVPLVQQPSRAATSEPFVIEPIDCPGALPTRLASYAAGRVAAGKTLTLRSAPNANSPPVTQTRVGEPFSGKVAAGTTFRIFSSSGSSFFYQCAAPILWWAISLDNTPAEGWVPELLDGEYVIEPTSPGVTATPIQYRAPLPTRTPAPIQTSTPTLIPTQTLIPTITLTPSITMTPSVVPTSGATPTPASGQASAVSSLAFSPDSSTFLAGYADGTARLWETQTGRLLREFKAKMDNIISVAFTPDGVQAMTASRNGYVLLWRATGDQPPLVYDLHTYGTLNCAQLSPDGAYLLTCSNDGSARLWHLGTPDPPELLQLKSPIMSGAFSSSEENANDDPYVLLGSSSSSVTVWWYTHHVQSRLKLLFVPDGQAVKTIVTNNLDFMGFVTADGSADFETYGTFNFHGQVLPDGTVPDTIKSYPQALEVKGRMLTLIGAGTAFAVGFSNTPLVELYASNPGGMGGTDPQAGQLLATATGHSASVTSIAFGGNKATPYILTGSLDTTVRLWDIKTAYDGDLAHIIKA